MRKLLLPILVLALVLGSCKDNLTSLNDNPKGASDVPAEPLFSNAIVEFGTLNSSVFYGTNAFKHMAQYWSQTSYPDETQYNLSGTSGNYWSWMYRNVLTDLKEASRLVSEDELIPDAQKTVMQAQIDLIEIMAFHQLVSVYGNVPYSKALDPANPAPPFDDEQEIYTKLLDRLDTAISDLGASSTGFSGSADIFYNGNVNNWIKFAHSLKMRMAIQLSDVQPSVAETAITEASPNAFQQSSESLLMPFTTSPPATNPMWELAVQENRSDLLPSKRLVDMMNSFDDPRRDIQFTEYPDGSGQYKGAPFGQINEFSKYSQPAGPIMEPDHPGTLLDYSEVEFIRAEAAERGWLNSNAAMHYNNAVKADMQYWSEASASVEITENEMDQYLAQQGVNYAAAGNKYKVIAEQKWLALYMQGLQAWTDYRRLDHPDFNVQNNENTNVTSEDDIPVRYTYPPSEQTLNTKNWEAAAEAMGGDELGSHLFWDNADATSTVD